jgi:hypothetical protein
MKHVLALLVAGAVISGVAAYAAVGRPAAAETPATAPAR